MSGEPIERRDVLSTAGTAALFVGGAAIVPESVRGDEDTDFKLEIVDVNEPVWGGQSGSSDPRRGDPLTFTVEVVNESEAGGSQTISYEVSKVRGSGPFAEGGTSVSLDGEDYAGYDSTEVTFEVDTDFNYDDRRVIISVVSDDGATASERVMMQATEFAEFDVSVDTEELEPAVEGEELAVPVEIENLGHKPDLQTVTASFDGSEVDSKEVELHWREETTETFTVPTERGDSGVHPFTVSTEDAAETVEVTVREGAYYEVDDIDYDTTVVGGDLTVTVEFTNTGENEGSETVVLDVPDVGTQETDVSLDPDESTTEELTLDTADAEPGTYTGSIEVTGSSHTLDVEIEEPALQVADLAVETPVEEGNDAVVEVTFENPSDVAVNEEVTISAGSLGEESLTVEADGEETVEETVAFGTEPGDAGEYVSEVATRVGTEEAEFVVEVPGAVAGDGDDEEGPGFGVGAAITGVAGAAYLARKRLEDQ